MKGLCGVVAIFAFNLIGGLYYIYDNGVDPIVILWGIGMILAGLLFSMAGYFYASKSIRRVYLFPKWVYYLFLVTLVLYLSVAGLLLLVDTYNVVTICVGLGMVVVAIFLARLGKLLTYADYTIRPTT